MRSMPSVVDLYGLKLEVTNLDRIENRVIESGIYEWPEASLIQPFLRPGSNAIDAGANIGIFSLLMARGVRPGGGKVYAFEPVPQNFSRLQRNIDLNGLPVEAIQQSLGDEQRTFRCVFIDRAEGDDPKRVNYGAFSLRAERQDGNIEVQTTTLDAFVAERGIRNISFLKIDVEGWEEKLLRGGANTLRKFKPSILIEIGEDSRPDGNVPGHARRVIELLKEIDYVCCRVWRSPLPFYAEIEETDFNLPIHFNAVCFHRGWIDLGFKGHAFSSLGTVPPLTRVS